MKRPNIIFYFSDQQRWDTLGCYGQPLPVTPNLDSLAAQGVRFEHAFTCQPVCGPARACLQSGKYATQVGCHRNAQALPQNITTLADHFNEAGYETAYVGKWHLASNRNSYTAPVDEENFETRAIPFQRRGGYRDYWMASDVLEGTSHGYNGYVFGKDGERHEFIGYRADAINNYAIHYLHQYQGEKPFFLFISQIEPHHQNDRGRFEGPDGSKERFKNFVPPADMEEGSGDWREQYPDYLGQCNSLDENVGRLVETLKERKLWAETILFYTSDHGCHFCTRNGEYKRSCHESSTRVPLIAIGGPFQGGKVVSNLVSLIDLPVTLLDCAGIEKPEDFQGHSLKKLVENPEMEWEDCVFMQISESQVGRAIRTPKWKYAVKADADGWECAGADVYYEEFLYDLEQDPCEKHNLVTDKEYGEVRKKLAEKLVNCMVRAGEKEPEIRSNRKRVRSYESYNGDV